MYLLVPKLCGQKEKPCLENVHARGDRDRIKILHADLCNHVLVCLQGDFEDVPLLRLCQEEEHGLRREG